METTSTPYPSKDGCSEKQKKICGCITSLVCFLIVGAVVGVCIGPGADTCQEIWESMETPEANATEYIPPCLEVASCTPRSYDFNGVWEPTTILVKNNEHG